MTTTHRATHAAVLAMESPPHCARFWMAILSLPTQTLRLARTPRQETNVGGVDTESWGHPRAWIGISR
jgi:hypothetical protein